MNAQTDRNQYTPPELQHFLGCTVYFITYNISYNVLWFHELPNLLALPYTAVPLGLNELPFKNKSTSNISNPLLTGLYWLFHIKEQISWVLPAMQSWSNRTNFKTSKVVKWEIRKYWRSFWHKWTHAVVLLEEILTLVKCVLKFKILLKCEDSLTPYHFCSHCASRGSRSSTDTMMTAKICEAQHGWINFIWACFLSLAPNKLRLCSANHRPCYWSNLPCDWTSTAWAYSEQQTEIRPCSWDIPLIC